MVNYSVVRAAVEGGNEKLSLVDLNPYQLPFSVNILWCDLSRGIAGLNKENSATSTT